MATTNLVCALAVLAACVVQVLGGPADWLRGQLSFNAIDEGTILSHKHKKDESICHRWDWRKKSLKLIKELPASGLFRDLHGHDKFETSGITHYNGEYVMVFDSLMELGFVDDTLEVFGEQNTLAGKPGGESEYEAITHRSRTNTLLAVNEGAEDADGHWYPIVYEVSVSDKKELKIVNTCVIDFDLPAKDLKGVEGAEYVDAGERGEFLLGLCEGNFCEGNNKRGRVTGNGRIILAKYEESDDGCKWATQRVINVPKSVDFRDYSDIDIHEGPGPLNRVAITSQEDAALWIGQMNLTSFEFVGDGEVLHFPRTTGDCTEHYCNVEGVKFIDEWRVMTTTDRSKADQPWTCSAKDQSVQIFALPHNKKLRPTDVSPTDSPTSK